MATTTFIWAVMAAALVGAAVGWGVSLLVESETDGLASAPLGRGLEGADLQALRQAAANDLELQAALREDAEAVESGQVPGGGANGTGAGGAGARNATPLTGTVDSFRDGMLTLDTLEGPAEIAVEDGTSVTLTTAALEAAAHLSEGARVTVAGTDDDGGIITAFVIAIGAAEGPGPRGFGMFTAISGTIESYDGAVLTVATEAGSVDAAVSERTVVQVMTTASEAADELANAETVTVFVRRNADGSLTAANVAVGDFGAFRPAGSGRGGFGGARPDRDAGG